MPEPKFFSHDIILLLAASFFYMASPMLVTPLVTGFAEQLGAGALVMGLVGGLTNLASLLCQPFTGGMADKTSKLKLGSIGSACLLIACIGYLLSVTPAMILFFRIINGVGFAFCAVSFSTWIANLLPPGRIGFGMGLYGMMNALAMAISPAIGVTVYQLWGYRPAFAIAACFALACLVIIRLCHNQGMPLNISPAEKTKRQFFEPRVLPLALVIMCFAIPYCATQSFIVRYAEARQLPVAVGMFFTIYALALLISRFALKNLFDRLAFTKFLVAGSICALLSLLCLTIMQNNLLMAGGAVFMAGGYGLMCTVAQSAAVTCVTAEKRGLANGTYYIGLNCGMALGPLLGGILYGNLPLELYYPMLMLSVPLCWLFYHLSTSFFQTGQS